MYIAEVILKLVFPLCPSCLGKEYWGGGGGGIQVVVSKLPMPILHMPKLLHDQATTNSQCICKTGGKECKVIPRQWQRTFELEDQH